MGDNNKKYSGFGYVVNPTRMWYNTDYKRILCYVVVCVSCVN